MTSKFHVNPNSGNPSECNALVKCPFGGEDKHYSSVSEARVAFEKSQGSQVSSVANKPNDKRLIDGNWTIPSHAASQVSDDKMSRHEMQLYTLSMISHNMHPAIGIFRLSIDSGDKKRLESASAFRDECVSKAVESISKKLDGGLAEHESFLTESIHDSFDPVFEAYEKDADSYIDLDPILDDFAIKIADYSKKV